MMELYREVIDKYGIEAQKDMLLEEMSELQFAILKARRKKLSITDGIIEEIADVEIVIDQLKFHYNIDTYDIKIKKLKRLQERLK